jgi:hypothetical protein
MICAWMYVHNDDNMRWIEVNIGCVVLYFFVRWLFIVSSYMVYVHSCIHESICGESFMTWNWKYLWWVLHDLKLKMRWTGYMFILIWGEWYRMHIVMSRVTWHEICDISCIRNMWLNVILGNWHWLVILNLND